MVDQYERFGHIYGCKNAYVPIGNKGTKGHIKSKY